MPILQKNCQKQKANDNIKITENPIDSFQKIQNIPTKAKNLR